MLTWLGEDVTDVLRLFDEHWDHYAMGDLHMQIICASLSNPDLNPFSQSTGLYAGVTPALRTVTVNMHEYHIDRSVDMVVYDNDDNDEDVRQHNYQQREEYDGLTVNDIIEQGFCDAEDEEPEDGEPEEDLFRFRS